VTAGLLPRARRALRAYLYHVATDDPAAAIREGTRILDTLDRFATATVDGVAVTIRGSSRPLRRHFIHPFHVYYERRPGGVLAVRLHHRARRPI
jgi:plasmid stabilization system protein ParE